MKLKTLPKIYLAYGALFIATAIWGIAVPIIKLTLNYSSVMTFLFFRFLIVCVILLPFVMIELKKNPLHKNDVFNLLLLGITGESSLIIVFWGLKYTSAIDAAVIGATAPIMAIIAGHYFYKDKITKFAKIGVIIATLGTLFVVIEPVVFFQKISQGSLLRIFGNTLMILYNFVFTWYVIFSRKVLGHNSVQITRALGMLHIKPNVKRYSVFLLTSVTFYVGFVTFIPLAILERFGAFGPVQSISALVSPIPLFGVLYMAIFSSIFANILFVWGLDKSSVSDSAIFSYLGPVFTLPFSYILLKEVPATYTIVGILILALGVIIAEKHKA